MDVLFVKRVVFDEHVMLLLMCHLRGRDGGGRSGKRGNIGGNMPPGARERQRPYPKLVLCSIICS